MPKFKALCGREYDIPRNKTHATSITLASKYPDSMSEFTTILSTECQQCPTTKFEHTAQYCSTNSPDLYPVTATFCIAHKVDREDFAPITDYDETASNTKEDYVFEVTLQQGSAIRYLYHSVPSRNMSAYDHMEDLIENIWEDQFDAPEVEIRAQAIEDGNTDYDYEDDGVPSVQMFDAESGSIYDIDLYSVEDLKKLVTSIKMVKFTQHIDPIGK